MSSNFLSLNPSKTEFLLVGPQLSKLSNPMIHLPNNVTLNCHLAVHSAILI